MASRAQKKKAKTENQRKVFEFFVERFKSQEPFTKKQVGAVTNWQGKSFPTYWSKQFARFVVPAGGNLFRVSEGFRPFARWETFRHHVTQVRGSSDYTLSVHDSVLCSSSSCRSPTKTTSELPLTRFFIRTRLFGA